ncbi:helix-turn-helix domain-containing protein [Delftia tsuruhatensis]
MSFNAIRWAMAQHIPSSSAKFVLVAMANCVNDKDDDDKPVTDWLCFPSVALLAGVTSMDRKTVITAMGKLRDLGVIADSGGRRGNTGQIVVFRLNPPKNGTVQQGQTEGAERGNSVQNSPENGSLEDTQKRNSSENGTVPLFPGNSTVFPVEQYRFSLETVPKTGHGTSKEPIKEPVKEPVSKKRASAPPVGVSVIPGVSAELLADYLLVRKTKKAGALTQTALRGLQREADKARISLAQAIEVCCEAGWQGFNASWYAKRIGDDRAPSGGHSQPRSNAGRHSGFTHEHSDYYDQGVPDDGSIPA